MNNRELALHHWKDVLDQTGMDPTKEKLLVYKNYFGLSNLNLDLTKEMEIKFNNGKPVSIIYLVNGEKIDHEEFVKIGSCWFRSRGKSVICEDQRTFLLIDH